MDLKFKTQLADKLTEITNQRNSVQHFVDEVFSITKNLTEIDLGDLDRIEVAARDWGRLVVRFPKINTYSSFWVFTTLVNGRLSIKVTSHSTSLNDSQAVGDCQTFNNLEDYQNFLVNWVISVYNFRIKALGE